MPTAESTFRLWMRNLIILFIVFMTYIVIADRHAPLTTESRVQGYVVQIASEVSGKVTDVAVINNQMVKKGDVLFTTDQRNHLITLEKSKVALEQAYEQEESLYAQSKAAIAKIATTQAAYNNANSEYLRVKKLAQRKLVSASMLDNAEAQDKVTRANLQTAKQQLRVIQAQLGDKQGESTMVRAARNNLKQAELDLSHTKIKAPSDGVITNLQLGVGSMVTANRPMVTFIPTDSMWVAADFREKAIALLNKESSAFVTYDALPGRVFNFDVKSRDFGVAAAQQTPNGQLTAIEVNNRWVRDAQRVRVNLSSNEAIPEQLFVGSRATVVIYPGDSPLWKTLAGVEIWIASLFHYIY